MDGLPRDIISSILLLLEVDYICRSGLVSSTWASCVRWDPIATKITAERPRALAKRTGNERIMELLGDGPSAPSSTRNFKGYNALHLAAQGGYLQLVIVLLDSGFSVDDMSARDETPLHLASWKGHYNVVKELLSRGCTVDPQDCNTKTPLIFAAQQGHMRIVTELIRRGADVNAQEGLGNSALMMAAWYGQSSIVGALISSGAKINMKGQSEKTALERAKQHRHSDVVHILSRAGAQEEPFTKCSIGGRGGPQWSYLCRFAALLLRGVCQLFSFYILGRGLRISCSFTT